MPIDLGFTISPNKFHSTALPNALRNLSKLPRRLEALGKLLTNEIKDNLSGRVLNARTGRLRGSWDFRVAAANRGWRLEVGSSVVYARIHEYGGWSGPGRSVRTPARRYVSLALRAKKEAIDKLLRDYIVNITVR